MPRFVFLAVVYFLLLMALVPTGFFPPVFRFGANAVFHSMGSDRVAKFERFDDPMGVYDTKMFVGSQALGRPTYASSIGVNSVRQGYAPLVLVIALVLATPVPWPRKWRALLSGMLLVNLFIVLRVGVALLYGFSRVGLGSRRLLEVSGPEAWLLRQGDQILAGDLHLTYVVPLLIWLLVAVRMRDFRTVLLPGGSQPPDGEEGIARRNSPCPCGSGRKFKHCCENNQALAQ